MRRIARLAAMAVLAVCVLMFMALLSPVLLIHELVFDEDDPAESYRRFW
jgi:hypothetical protein